MTEGQLRKKHGWTSNSRMTSRYAHIVQVDGEEAILNHYGIENKEEEKLNLPKICKI
ncbi:MAG TPA: hypothetical protein VMW74_05500 [Nitrosopumilaceae archaeon]|nr:hypothetical protein [Nitrosopumilaceae archaeon]